MPTIASSQSLTRLPSEVAVVAPGATTRGATGAHIGGRKTMEDVAVLFDGDATFFGGGVFDGAGGPRAAKTAAAAFAHLFDADRRANVDVMKDHFARAETQTLATAAKKGKWPDVTTAVVAVVDADNVVVGWAGDSVALVVDDKHVTALTRPHLASDPTEARRIKDAGGSVGRSPAEARASSTRKLVGKLAPAAAFGAGKKNPKRVYPGGITVTRAIGGLPLKYADPKLVVAVPDVVVLPRNQIKPGSKLVLASDGLLEKLDHLALVDLIHNHPPDHVARVAADKNTNDNIALAVFDL
mmetsp:Transcript_8144/g.21116  ORF Transcript_8144/g.21116 Transcript_8144/m.21116 type:complete len:298 (+) Transcript_8144:1226-2119(+)